MSMRYLAIISLFALQGQAQHGQLEDKDKAKHPFIGDPAAIEAGHKQFANGCAACHGAEGKGGRGPNLLERLRSDEVTDPILYQVIQKGVPGGGMPGANLSENEAWQLIAFLRSETSPAVEGRPGGDSKAGEQIFWDKAKCGGCHAIQGRGGRIGPDLTNIGALRTRTQLRDAVLAPDLNPVQGYQSATVLLKDGTALRGVARNRTNYSLQLQDKDGNLHLLQMDRIREITISKHSIMPNDYGQRLGAQELQNVLAYLSRQSIRPVETAKK